MGIIISGKVDTATIEITATKTDTITKLRVISQVTNQNIRREIPRSPSHMNHLILFWQNLENHFSDNST